MGFLEKQVFLGGVFVENSWCVVVNCGVKDGLNLRMKNTPRSASLFSGFVPKWDVGRLGTFGPPAIHNILFCEDKTLSAIE